MNLNIWDVGGQKTIRSYWRNYFEATEAIIWVVDSGDKVRLNDCKEELHKLLLTEKLAGATLLIFCNKQDLPGALKPKDISEFLDVNSIQNRHYQIISCSAMTGEGLKDGMEWLVDDIKLRICI